MQQSQLKNLWQQVLIKARNRLSEGACEKWLDPLKPVALEKNVLSLSASDDLQRQWVEERYLTQIEEAFFDLSGEHLSIEIKTAKKKSKSAPVNELQTTLSIPEENFEPAEQPVKIESNFLNRRYTFENFVIGKSNEFAHAAALAISKSPGKTYNPFFIYGGVGLGKTHLMHAIGNKILDTMPTKKILYVSSEQFTNDLISSIREHKIGAFKNRYRSVDVLLIDDVQFLSGKDSTQEEFFHTFNELHNLDKQIIISGDQPPQQIIGLEERLRSRFAWGLCTDIQKPDLETRIAILQKKAMIEKILIPSQILADIATKIDSNVRDLEGAFTRVVARASLMNKTFESAFYDLETDDKKSTASDVFVESKKITLKPEIPLKQIVATVANYFAVDPELILNNSRAQRVVRPRQISMFLCRALTSTSWAVIAKFFGKRDHATVMRAYNKVQKELATSPKLKNLIGNLFPEYNLC